MMTVTQDPVVEPPPPRVFISYAHDSAEHEERVRNLWVFLRAHGIDAKIDLPAAEQRQDWPLWMSEQVRQAQFILAVASPEYRRRAEGRAEAEVGRGVQYEAALLREILYEDRTRSLSRILPGVRRGGPGAEPSRLAAAYLLEALHPRRLHVNRVGGPAPGADAA